MDKGQVLESWKAISAFLGHDVRTCQRWERDLGLPIHRLDSSSRARVYAYPAELTAWLDDKLHKRESAPKAPPRRLPLLRLVALFCVVAGFVTWRLAFRREPPPLPAGFVPPVLGVLTFENKSGDTSLDYWREALAELLVADLSQSRYIRVVSCDQMLTALRRLGLAEAERYSSEDLEKIAARTQAAHVLEGSFIKAGETIVITAGLHETGLGRRYGILKCVARDEYDIIPELDKLARRIMKELRFTRSQIAYDFAKEAGQAVTSSPDALKLYVEGRRHQLGNRWNQAIASMESAIKIDPEFAMAFRTLGTAYRDLGHFAQARACIEKALELGARLPDGERQLIEGQIAFWDEDYARAMEILDGLLRDHPGHLNALTYLGYSHDAAGNVDKAIEYQGRVTRDRNTVLDVRTLAAYLQKSGRYDEATTLCLSFLRDVENARGVREMLVYSYALQGRLDLALVEARSIYREDPGNRGHLANVLVFMDDLSGAEKLRGPERTFLDRGRFGAHVDHCRKDMEGSRGNIGDERAASRRFAIALEKAGRFAEASIAFSEYLKLCEGSRTSDGGAGLPYGPRQRIRDLFAGARIQAGRGAIDEVRKAAGELRLLGESGINPKELRYHEYVLGLVERAKGNPRGAADFFGKACGRLDHEDFWDTEHAVFLFPYALALLEAGDLDRSRETFEKITLLTTGRLEHGDIHARARYWLGKIAGEQGEEEKARGHFRKFLALWAGADPGLPEVEDASSRLSRR